MPHLKELGSQAFDNSHLGSTWWLQYAYGKEVERIIDGMWSQDLAQSIWKSIIEDHYINFEKLFVTMDPDYDPNDNAKDFAEEFALIKKESVSAKQGLHIESNWNCVFTA